MGRNQHFPVKDRNIRISESGERAELGIASPEPSRQALHVGGGAERNGGALLLLPSSQPPTAYAPLIAVCHCLPNRALSEMPPELGGRELSIVSPELPTLPCEGPEHSHFGIRGASGVGYCVLRTIVRNLSRPDRISRTAGSATCPQDTQGTAHSLLVLPRHSARFTHHCLLLLDEPRAF